MIHESIMQRTEDCHHHRRHRQGGSQPVVRLLRVMRRPGKVGTASDGLTSARALFEQRIRELEYHRDELSDRILQVKEAEANRLDAEKQKAALAREAAKKSAVLGRTSRSSTGNSS